jgi:methyl-accepting chemotaxis protein
VKALRNLKIATKISLGFGGILLLLVVLSAVSAMALRGAQDNFGLYRQMMGQMARMAMISDNAQAMQMAAIRALESFDATAKAAVAERREQIEQALSDSRARSPQGQGEPFFKDLEQALTAYHQAFDLVSAAQETAEIQYEQSLAVLGPEIERTLTDISKGSANRGQAAAAHKAAVAAQAFVVARASVFQYLRDHAASPHLAKSTLYYFDEYAKAYEAMVVALEVPRLHKIAQETEPKFAAYRQAFGQMVEAFKTRDELVHGRLDVQGPAVLRLLEDHLTALNSSQKQLEEQATQSISRLLLISTVVAALAIVCGILAAFLIGRGIARPISGMTHAMRVLADGDQTVVIPGLDQRDEVGQMAHAVQVFKDSMRRADMLAAEQAAEHLQRDQRAAQVQGLTQTFEASVGGVLEAVHGAVGRLHQTAQQMSEISATSTGLAQEVTHASARAAQNVQTVASAAEELSASIGEIARQVQQSNSIGQRASDEAAQTTETVRGLAQSVNAIGEVVALITAIADQTNLLALNATIEAARAGDAGKGFAVVANEVKTLATQTSKATDDIDRRIQQIQGETHAAVKAIEGINRTISDVSGVIAAIASAVEQQNAATHEIAQNVQQAAVSTQAVSDTIAGVQQAAVQADQAASDVVSSSDSLWQQADSLKHTVHTFLDGVARC